MPSVAANRSPAQVIPRILALLCGGTLVASTLVTWATVNFYNNNILIKPVPGIYSSTVVPGYTFKLFNLKEGWEIVGIGIAVVGVIAVAISFVVRDNVLMGVCPLLGLVVGLLGMGASLRADMFKSQVHVGAAGTVIVKVEPSTGFLMAAAAAAVLVLMPLIARLAGYRPPSHKVAFNDRFGPDYSTVGSRVAPERPAAATSEFVGGPPPSFGSPPPPVPVMPSPTGQDPGPLAPPTPPFGGVGQADTFVPLPIIGAAGAAPAGVHPVADGVGQPSPHPVPVPSPPPPGGTPAGWYPDPYNPAQQRYWSGTSWTGHTAPR